MAAVFLAAAGGTDDDRRNATYPREYLNSTTLTQVSFKNFTTPASSESRFPA